MRKNTCNTLKTFLKINFAEILYIFGYLNENKHGIVINGDIPSIMT